MKSASAPFILVLLCCIPLPTVTNGSDWRIPIRDSLVADRTYYVRADGDDSNSGLIDDAAGALLTIQRAIDIVCDDLDIGAFNVTIKVGDGTYDKFVIKPFLGSGIVTINGNPSTPANVIVTTSQSGADAIKANYTHGSQWTISNLSVSTTGSGRNAVSVGAGYLELKNLRFLATVGIHMIAQNSGYIYVSGDYVIAGGGTRHIYVQQNGTILLSPPSGTMTVTLSGTPGFTSEFAGAVGGMIRTTASIVTFSGAATGVRYSASANGVIHTSGGSSSYFPGSSAGTTSTGGQYL